ncbi:M56 family metallopeptidase [Ureibacillus sp. Re31]|uniref:M56 family metallopeptidase n=1 Tax=Ureibacillus galli TaxID=2762222 RepID=A0ABR8XD40_9BACL|nr:M56 family metallopeptidase [Ureibacillus galli]MBD8027142.1 M56 family metallopeptidase [Ureibacillus galli]
MSKRRSTFTYLFPLAISSIIFIQMGLYILSIFGGWNTKYNLVVACHSLLKAIGLSSLRYALDLLVFYTVLYLLWKIGSQLFNSWKLKRKFKQYQDITLTNEFNIMYHNEKDDIVVISHPIPLAITMGFIRPKIVFSTGLINLLTDEELRSVITHEFYHFKNRDPLKVFLISLCASTMWYIPILQWFTQQYRIIQELLADEYAIKKQNTSVYLSSALLKMIKVGKQQKMPFAYVSFADTSVNYRIEYILNPLKNIEWKIPKKESYISVFIFLLICLFFIYALA